MADETSADLSSSRTVARSAFWNLLGRLGPLSIAILVTPFLVRDLGPSRWGIFTIALSLVGIFGIFDFGIGRAMTRTLSEMLSLGESEAAASVARTGAITLTALGCAGTVVMAGLSHWWVNSGMRVPSSLRHEVSLALYVLCMSAPLVILNSALWGIIAAYQAFRSANLINVPIMAMYYIGPLLTLQWKNSLVAALGALVLCRAVMTIAYWRICIKIMPGLSKARFDTAHLHLLLRFGGWMTAANVIWPVLTYIDRFVIASAVSAAATGYFSTPLDLVMRFTIIPIAIMGTAFPAMAASFRVDVENTRTLFRRSIVSIVSLMFPACLIVVGFSHWLLTLWLGAEFASHAAGVLRWLGIGILINSVDSVVAGLIDGVGRPSVNAKFSMTELILYLPFLVIMVRLLGIEGAAIAWLLRSTADLLVRLVIVRRIYPPVAPVVAGLAPSLLGVVTLLLTVALINNFVLRAVLMCVGGVLFTLLLWHSLTLVEREKLRAQASRVLTLP